MNPAPPVMRYLLIVPSDRIVFEPQTLEIVRVVNISAVENYRNLEQLFNSLKIRPAKLIPFRQDQQRRSPVEGVIVSVGVLDAIAKNLSRFFHPFRIEGLHPRAGREQGFDDRNCRSVAHVISARFEGETPDGKGQAG